MEEAEESLEVVKVIPEPERIDPSVDVPLPHVVDEILLN